MVRLLIRGQLPRWADRVDYSSLERLPTELIADKFRARRLDLAWGCRTKDGQVELLVLLELQGRQPRHMSVRTMVYGGLAIQDRLKRQEAGGEAAPGLAVESLVLYHGDGDWKVARRVGDVLVDSAPDRYTVVTPLPQGAPDPGPLDLPRMVLGLGRTLTNEEMLPELRRLRRVLRQSGDADFDRSMAATVRRLLASRGLSEELLKEVRTMEMAVAVFKRSMDDLARRSERKGVERGLRLGRMEGRVEGRMEGRSELLCRLAARRFGHGAARELASLLDRVTDPGRLDGVADAILDCDSAEALLDHVRSLR